MVPHQPSAPPAATETHASALELVRQLQTDALRGDLSSMLCLVDLARESTRAAHSLFGDATPPLRPSDYFKAKPFPNSAERREAMRFYFGASQPFPAFHFFGNDAVPEAKTQKANLHTLEHGAFKGRSHRGQPRFFWLLVHRVIESIRHDRSEPVEDWAKQARDLSDLNRETIAEWADIAAAWYALRHVEHLTNRHSLLHNFALIDHKKEQAKSLKRLSERYREEGAALNALNERNGLPHEPHIPPTEKERVKNRRPSLAMLKQGLRSQFTKYLRANIPPQNLF